VQWRVQVEDQPDCTIFGEQQVNDEQELNDELQVKTSGVVEQVLDVDVVTTGDDSEGGFLQASDDSFYDTIQTNRWRSKSKSSRKSRMRCPVPSCTTYMNFKKDQRQGS
jgi:hypothetical protein